MSRRHTKKQARRRHSRHSRKRGGVEPNQNTAAIIAQLQAQLAELQRQRKAIEDELARRQMEQGIQSQSEKLEEMTR